MSQEGRGAYRRNLETRCSTLLAKNRIPPCPPSYAPLQPKVRSAIRGEDCSICDQPIPLDKNVDPDPKEYVCASGHVVPGPRASLLRRSRSDNLVPVGLAGRVRGDAAAQGITADILAPCPDLGPVPAALV